MFKKILDFKNKCKNIYKDEKLLNEFLIRTLTSKKLFAYILISNLVGMVYWSAVINENNFEKSWTRFISRKIGKIGDFTIPEFLRNTIYSIYIKSYNVNRDEILDQNLKNYKNIKQFFIREIDVGYY